MDSNELAEKFALRELVYRYAKMVDARTFDEIPALFTEDMRLSGPGYAMNGHVELRGGLELIAQYDATLHCVHNHLVTLHGASAEGETYCVAGHLYEKDGVARKLDMGIHYHDAYQRGESGWRFSKRHLDVVWQQDLPLQG